MACLYTSWVLTNALNQEKRLEYIQHLIRVQLDYCLRALVLTPLKPDWSMNGQMILTLMMIVAAIVTWGLLTSYSLLINPALPCIPCIPTHASYHCSLAELAKLLRNSAPLEHNKSLVKQIIK